MVKGVHMKPDRKIKAEKPSPKIKAVKETRRTPLKSNGKHPLVSYEHIPIGIVECSPEGKYIEVNEEFCRITGYTRSMLLRRDIKALTHEDDYAIDIKLHHQLVVGQIPFYRLEKRYVRKDGENIWVELTRSLVRNADGKPLYTIGVVLDISERKQVERVLRESVERLRLATGAAQMFTWEWDFQTNSYILEDNFEKVLGFSAGLLPKNKLETLWALSPEEDIRHISEEFENAVTYQRIYMPCPTACSIRKTIRLYGSRSAQKLFMTMKGIRNGCLVWRRILPRARRFRMRLRSSHACRPKTPTP